MTRRLIGCFLATTVWAMALPVASVRAEAPDVKVSLHVSVASIAPGEAFDAAIQFEIPDDWHIYWKNPGDSGLAPRIDWRLPEGFVTDEPLFPAPQKHESSGIVTNVLEGKVTLLVKVTPPNDLVVGKDVTLAADVSWLVCKEECYPQDGKVSVTVPVTESSKRLEAKDEILFRLARRRMPVAPNKARAVRLEAEASKAKVAKGDTFDIQLGVDIKKGYHAQSNKPLSEFFIPSEVFVAPIEGITAMEAVWPDPHIRVDKNLGKVSEFSDRIQVRVPLRVHGPTAGEIVRIDGLFRYQACNDGGQCFPVEAVPWSVTIESDTVQAVAADPRDGSDDRVADAGDVASANANNTATDDASTGGGDALSRKIKTLEAEGGFTARLVGLGLIGWIVLGILGGLILNIMPCVLPVISIKIMSFVQQAGESPRRVFHLGLVFSAGIMVSFWVLAAAILMIRHYTGLGQSWGALFQQPLFVVGMTSVVFVFALSLFGVFEINLSSSAATSLEGVSHREGFGGAFMKGVLATLLATPCTAPLLAPAISLALAADVLTTATLFTAVGFGMSLPYLLLTANPGWMKYLPRAGNWMIAFKQFMGFLLIGTAVWLLWIFGKLMGADAMAALVAFLGFLALACWLFGKVSFNWSGGRRMVSYLASLGIVWFGGWFSYGYLYEPPPAKQATANSLALNPCEMDWSAGIPWVDFEKGLPERLAAEGYTVYVDYTAAWCLTCQANKKVALGDADVQKQLRDGSIVPIKADFTRYDPDIQADLDRYGRDAVPLNVILPAKSPDKPIVLPNILLPSIVLAAIEQAGPSKQCPPLVASANAP